MTKAPIHPRAGQSGTKVAKTARPSFFEGFSGVGLGEMPKPKGKPETGIIWDIMGIHGRQWVLTCSLWEKLIISES